MRGMTRVCYGPVTDEAMTVDNVRGKRYQSMQWRGACSACTGILFFADSEDEIDDTLVQHFFDTHRVKQDVWEQRDGESERERGFAEDRPESPRENSGEDSKRKKGK